MEGRLIKITNSNQWIVLRQWEENGTYYQFAYLLHPDSMSDSNVSGTMVTFELVDGYAKLIK